MVSELICLAIFRFMRGHRLIVALRIADFQRESTEHDAASDSDIYRHLLTRYALPEIDAAMRWFELSGYITECSGGARGPIWRALTATGREAADTGFSQEERRLFYPVVRPHTVFVAHQFNEDNTDLVEYIRDRVLAPHGYTVVDGRADGLEAFRTAIIKKIREARFFFVPDHETDRTGHRRLYVERLVVPGDWRCGCI